MSEKLKSMTLNSDNMEEVYDVSAGQPVLHNTALQFAISYCEGDLSHQVYFRTTLFYRSFLFEYVIETR